jgi:two-component system chemotaxis response regulator CheB
MNKPVRVLVIDDSALMRKLIPRILERDPGIEVVGTAIDGNFGLKKIGDLSPDVVTLDLEMPGLNGIDTLKQIMRRWRIPVVVVSSHSTAGAAITLKALTMGAFDFVAKPADVSTRMPEIAEELIRKIRAAAQNRAVQPLQLPEETPSDMLRKQRLAVPTRVIAIGISTGGPNALQYLFSNLPVDFSGTILVVQHMPDGFTELFARRLDETCPIRVKEAQSGDLLVAGRALICPGNRHMKVKKLPLGNVSLLTDDGPVNGHRPSADVLFRSVAQEFGSQALGLLMTGMGEDGAAGMGAIQAAGGLTVAQSQETCVVYGMPKVAIERGFVTRIEHLQDLPGLLQAQCGIEPNRGDEAETGKAASIGSN